MNGEKKKTHLVIENIKPCLLHCPGRKTYISVAVSTLPREYFNEISISHAADHAPGLICGDAYSHARCVAHTTCRSRPLRVNSTKVASCSTVYKQAARRVSRDVRLVILMQTQARTFSWKLHLSAPKSNLISTIGVHAYICFIFSQ